MKNIRRLFPLTLNALILLLASGYCLSLIAKTDLLATIFAYSLIGLVLIITTIVIVNFVILKRKLDLQLARKNKTATQYLDRPAYLELKIKNLQIFPLCQVKIKLNFQNSKFSPPLLVLKTKELELSTEYQVNFPHHGDWQLANIQFTVSDLFNLATITSTQTPQDYPAIRVEPPRLFTPELPLVFSSLTAGDRINIPQKKLGDYYDLKKYHPSDGISKIVWKIFARSQELIARHPEDTALPAGKSLVFLFAGKEEPELARHCLNYLEQIQKKDLEFIFDSSGKYPAALNDLEAAKDLLLANIWSAEPQSWEKNKIKFTQLLGKDHSCLEIAVFMMENNPISKALLALCKSKNVKVLIMTSKKSIIPISPLNKFLFYKSKISYIAGADKIISKYV